MPKKKPSLPEKVSPAKLVPWKRVVPLSVFKLEKGSRAGVVLDQAGTPQFFIFDTFAFLDILSAIDERLLDQLSSADYYSKKVNPAGWLIDQIESKLPLNPKYLQSLKSAIDEANKKGWVPFSKIQSELNLN